MQAITETLWFDDLARLARRVVVEPGQPVRHAGVCVDAVDFVIAGVADIWHVTQDGREAWLGALGANDIIGTALNSRGKDEPFAITAYSRVTLLRLALSAVPQLLARHPTASSDWAERFIEGKRDAQWAGLRARLLPATSRVEAELLRLSRSLEDGSDSRVIRPNPALTDVARRSDTTRETASRVVSRLCRAGVLERRPGALVIAQSARLEDQIASSV